VGGAGDQHANHRHPMLGCQCAVTPSGLASIECIIHDRTDVIRIVDRTPSSATYLIFTYLSSIRAAVERFIAHLKLEILATRYRQPLRKLAFCLAVVTAL
jgi:hypothetical protein